MTQDERAFEQAQEARAKAIANQIGVEQPYIQKTRSAEYVFIETIPNDDDPILCDNWFEAASVLYGMAVGLRLAGQRLTNTIMGSRKEV